MIPWSGVWAALANHLWQSTLFAAAAAILTLPLRKNQAQVRYRLYLVASLKFLIPFSPLIVLGSHLARLNHSAEREPVFYFVVQAVSQPFHQASSVRAWLSLLPLLPLFIVLLWLLGLATVAGLWCMRWRRVARAIRSSAALSRGREVDALRAAERAAGLRRPTTLCMSQDSLEPGVFGIARPCLLWPAGISEHLQDAHVEAILAHEVQHVRRRDNLAAAIHMVVQAVFWFHPLVWWLGGRLVEERERACDEAVLRLGNSPQIYAESILKTCEFSVTSPLACVTGVTGGDLKNRIVRIMSASSGDRLTFARKLLLLAVGLGSIAGPVLVGLARGPQAGAQSPPADAATPQIYHIGGDVAPPKLIYAPDPEFTDKARKAKYQGVCILSVVVDAQGKPQKIQVVRHLGMGLTEKAIAAVQQYKFTPALLHGQPVAVEVQIEVNFRRV
jgi:bla regulator protein BlaR1